jgi:hypothetical protein
MRMHAFTLALGLGATAALSAGPGRADDRAPLPPPVPSPQTPGLPEARAPAKPAPQAQPQLQLLPQAQAQAAPPPAANPPQSVTLQLAAPPAAPAQPPAQPQTITLNLVTQPPPAAPPPQQQSVTLSLVPQAPAAAAPIAPAIAPAQPAVQFAKVHYPGPLRLAVGAIGERLAMQRMARVYVPIADAQVQPVQGVRLVQAPVQLQTAQAPMQVPVQAVEAMPVLASPQSHHKWFHFRR